MSQIAAATPIASGTPMALSIASMLRAWCAPAEALAGMDSGAFMSLLDSPFLPCSHNSSSGQPFIDWFGGCPRRETLMLATVSHGMATAVQLLIFRGR
jgi:hypothetical protein